MTSSGASTSPIIGILGGMGPEATVELMKRIVAATPAKDDADHIHLIVDNNPNVPSRIAALIDETGESPLPVLQQMAKRLEAAGANVLAIACNTAHWYAEDIAKVVRSPVLDMVALTADRIALNGTYRKVGLLASTAVIKIGLYRKELARHAIETVVPRRQEDVMIIIRAIKAGKIDAGLRSAFAEIANELLSDGVDLLLVACTELSVVADAIPASLPVIDALDVLTDEIVAAGKSGAPMHRHV